MKKNAFTLIELIVGITISMMLMVSVGIFVNNGMANIITQQKVIENTTNLTEFTSKIHTAINLMQSGSIFPAETTSGIIFKRDINLGEGGFTYIGTTNSTIDSNGNGIYCDSGSEDTNTKHIILKNFIPFEEEGENIFTNYTGSLESTITIGTKIFKSLQKENRIVIKKPGNVWKTIIGKGIFGNKLKEGDSGKNIYLNGPTGLAKSGSNILFISDTLNNRILYYKISEDEIYTLLDESDGLKEPTGLYYDSTENTLYISNSGKGEILKYFSKTSTDKKINIDLQLDESINNIKKIELNLYSSITDITYPNSKNDFSINGITTSTDYFTGSSNKITYWFTNFGNNYFTQNNTACSGPYTKYYENSNNIIKEEIASCSSLTGTLKKYKTSQTINRNNGTNIQISTLNDIQGTDLSINGTYYIELNIIGDTTYTRYFPLFINSDNNILTLNDNTLEIVKPGLEYPTGLWWDSGITYNEFGDGTYLNLKYNSTDTILKTPINYLNTYISNGMITLVLKYYKKYNCYNLNDKSERTYLFKKNL